MEPKDNGSVPQELIDSIKLDFQDSKNLEGIPPELVQSIKSDLGILDKEQPTSQPPKTGFEWNDVWNFAKESVMGASPLMPALEGAGMVGKGIADEVVGLGGDLEEFGVPHAKKGAELLAEYGIPQSGPAVAAQILVPKAVSGLIKKIAPGKLLAKKLSMTTGEKVKDLERIIAKPEALDSMGKTAEEATEPYLAAITKEGESAPLKSGRKVIGKETGKLAPEVADYIKASDDKFKELVEAGYDPDNKVTAGLIDALDDQEKLTTIHAINARRAAGKHSPPEMNEFYKDLISSMKRNGFPNIEKETEAWGDWAASRKFLKFLPRNRAGDYDWPKVAAMVTATVKYGVPGAIAAAAASPLVVGKTIRALGYISPVMRELAKAGKPVTYASINAMLNKKSVKTDETK